MSKLWHATANVKEVLLPNHIDDVELTLLDYAEEGYLDRSEVLEACSAWRRAYRAEEEAWRYPRKDNSEEKDETLRETNRQGQRVTDLWNTAYSRWREARK